MTPEDGASALRAGTPRSDGEAGSQRGPRSTDEELLASFESCALPPGQLRHREHVRIAWLYLREATHFEEAGLRFCRSLRRFAAAHGQGALYSETITWAYLALVNERMKQSPQADFDAFAGANPDLLEPGMEALARYYDRETLRSDAARRAFLLPRRAVDT